MKKLSVWSLMPDELQATVLKTGQKKYRADQMLNWIYRQNVTEIDLMSNISKAGRELFKSTFSTALPEIDQISSSSDGTAKYLIKLEDSNYIEMVIIPAETKNTLCISSQVGCRRGCRFCATARLGFIRDLAVEEIVSQVYLARQMVEPAKLTNLVFMGMGEPLDNLDNVIKSIRILQSEKCFAFSPRRITVSTCGVIPEIYKLSASGLKVKLAVSLNAAIDAKRQKIMPVTIKYPLNELKKALHAFSRQSPFRITFEYVMIRDFNMGSDDLKALRKFTGDIASKINLIPWNPLVESEWQSPSEQEIDNFVRQLYELSAVPVTLRNSRGSDINAACGMLAGKKEKLRP